MLVAVALARFFLMAVVVFVAALLGSIWVFDKDFFAIRGDTVPVKIQSVLMQILADLLSLGYLHVTAMVMAASKRGRIVGRRSRSRLNVKL